MAGEIFVRNQKQKYFHHLFEKAQFCAMIQAAGWTLLWLAGLWQFSYITLGMRAQYLYLLPSGWESIFFCGASLCLLLHVDLSSYKKGIGRRRKQKEAPVYHKQALLLYLVSIIQDIILMNICIGSTTLSG